MKTQLSTLFRKTLPSMLAALMGMSMMPQSVVATPPATGMDPTAGLIPTDVAKEARVRSDIRLVFSGGTMGVGSGRYHFQIPEIIASHTGEDTPRLDRVTPIHGVLVQNEFSLWTEDHSTKSVIDFLDKGPITCGNPSRAVELKNEFEQMVLIDAPALTSWLSKLPIPDAQREPLALRTCTNSAHASAVLLGPAFDAPEPASWDLHSFEFRLALQLDFQSGDKNNAAMLIGIPEREASRRFQHLQNLLQEKNHTFYVDAGSFLDGSSAVRDGSLSLHRKLTLSMLSELGATALAPADTELVAGAENLVAEAQERDLPYIATNWESEDPNLQLPKYLIREVPDDEGVIRFAFLAVTDPAIAKWIPRVAADGVTLVDPVDSINRVVRNLNASPEPPDLVVVLTTGQPQTLSRMKAGLRGVDLVLGDISDQNLRMQSFDIDVVQQADSNRKVAAILPVEDIASADLTFSRRAGTWSLRRVESRPHRITGAFPPNPRVLTEITKTRAQVYPGRDQVLLPSPDGAASKVWRGEDWDEIVCEAVRAATDADAVLLPSLPSVPLIPGPLTELMVMDRLALLDRLEEHEIPGDKLMGLLPPAQSLVTKICGARLKPSVLIRGRAIDPDRVYRIITTDRASAGLLDALLARAYSPRILDQPAYQIIRDEKGSTITLRHAVLSLLRRQSAALTAGTQNPLLTLHSAEEIAPQWSFKIQRLSVRAARFEGSNDEQFAQVPETLATSPSTFSLATDSDMSLIYDTGALRNDLRFRGTYAELSFDSGTEEELADDLRLSFSTEIPRFSLTISEGIPAFSPYGEILLDTEFTPIEAENETLPRQADISFTAGVSARKFGDLKILRLGAFVLSDLSDTERFADYGARTEAQTLTTFGPGLRFSTTVDARLYGTTPDDDASDLRFKTLVDARLATPLIRYLDLSFFAQGFFFRGRVPETATTSKSYTLGFSLDFRGVFDL